jgi:xanthine/CO dehydrogenase XdhC/CoxF family maturation factor
MMDENLTVFDALVQIKTQDQNAALATVVRTSGSTYRKEGAKMLITESGEMLGNISAGCLEKDVREIAPEVMSSGQSRLLHYDNTAVDDIIWGLGLGCNGVVEVFVAPAFSADRTDVSIYEVLKNAIEDESPVSLAIVIASEVPDIPVAAKMLTFPNGKISGTLGAPELNRRVVADAGALLAKELSRTLQYTLSDKVTVYIESVLPRPSLVIVGADPDAVPIIRLAKHLGFKTVLVDHREMFANRKKYPDADEIRVIWPEDLATTLPVDDKTCILIKTHNYLKDKEVLKFALKAGARYIGQMGPKARATDLLSDLGKDGVSFTDAELQVLHAPVGLDVGAESPEQVAVSILAELLAVKNGRSGAQLRFQTAAIHPRENDAV